MKSIKTIESKIKQLQGRLKKKLLVENFGDKEQKILEDFVGDIYEYPYAERLIITDRIDDFSQWCMNYTGNH